MERVPSVKRQWMSELEARLAHGTAGMEGDSYQALLSLSKIDGRKYAPNEDPANAPLDNLLQDVLYLKNRDPEAESQLLPAMVGQLDLPSTLLSEIADDMPNLLEPEVRAKNARQRCEWSNK